jgi:transcriptional regulator with XRE-family HTH domain
MNKNTFGGRLRQLREEKSISLRELAKRIGVSAPFLSDIELGRRLPAADKLEILAKELQVSVEEFTALDFRDEAETIKAMMFSDPKVGMAFRTFTKQLQNGRSPEEIISKLQPKPRKAE